MVLLELCLSPGVGGLELYALKVIKHYHSPELASQHTCISVVAKNSFLDQRLEKINIKRQHLEVHNSYFPLLAARRLAKLIDKHGVDTIHIHWRGDLPLAAFAVKFSNKPVKLVYTRQMALTRAKFDIYHRFLYRQVSLYLTITRQLQDDARHYLPMAENKIQLLYYGVPKPEPASDEQCQQFFRQAKLDTPSFTIGLFGRIEHGKGQHLLFEAARTLLSRGLDIKVLLIGHIMDQNYFDKLMENAKTAAIDDKFRYFGFHDNPSSVMACFDVVVLATKSETFGLVLPEAMRAGTAVIGSNAGGVPEIIQHEKTGLLFEPENSNDLAECLEKLAKDTALKNTLAGNGKEYADKMFSEEMHFEKLEKFLRG